MHNISACLPPITPKSCFIWCDCGPAPPNIGSQSLTLQIISQRSFEKSEMGFGLCAFGSLVGLSLSEPECGLHYVFTMCLRRGLG